MTVVLNKKNILIPEKHFKCNIFYNNTLYFKKVKKIFPLVSLFILFCIKTHAKVHIYSQTRFMLPVASCLHRPETNVYNLSTYSLKLLTINGYICI